MTMTDGTAFVPRDPRDVATALADALAEHEFWLRGWQRAMVCGLPVGADVIDADAHRRCRFGRWVAAGRSPGVQDGELLGQLEAAHREMHEAARAAARRAVAGRGVSAPDYDAVMEAAEAFRKAAARLRDASAEPGEATAPAAGLAALQDRLTMFGELERERERTLRTGMPASLAMVCPRGFDEIEREHGADGLDRALGGLAFRLFALVRPYDGLYRYGRTELLLCLPGATTDDAAAAARRLLDGLRETPFAVSRDAEARLDGRVGVAAIDPHVSVQESVERAARAVAMAGDGGGKSIVVWSPDRAS